MSRAAESCARELLETVPAVMRFIRDGVRQRRVAGLALPQFRTLVFLNRVRDSSLSAVAEHLGMSVPAMSRLINGLVVSGLVGRRAVPSNRRQVALTLTARGRATLETVRDEVRLRLADSLAILPASEQKAIQRAMLALRNVFGPRNAAGGKTGRNQSKNGGIEHGGTTIVAGTDGLGGH